MADKTPRDWQMLKADISFGLMGMFGVLGLAIDSFDTTPDFVMTTDPWLTAGASVLLMGLVGLIVTKIAALDRRRSEEYTFQILSSGAVVAVVTTLFVSFIWSSDLLLSRWLGTPTPGQMTALLLGSWSVGYFTYRIRGVSK